MTQDHDPQDNEFDLLARAELSLAYPAGQPPARLFRTKPLLRQRGVQWAIAALLVVSSATGTVLVMRPSEFVRGAIEHEYYERTLRGNFMEAEPLLQQLGLSQSKAVPGFPQLMRPCDIDGHLVYHLTTFFEKGGMVTVFAFNEPITIKEGAGWWDNVYWQVVTSRDGKPLVLVSQKKQALSVAELAFGKSAS